MLNSIAVGLLLAAAPLKKTISWSPPPSTEDDRPLISSIIASAQDTDYVLTLELDKAPFGEACQNHCVNATVFLDTDNSKGTGLKLKDSKAPEAGADLAIIVQAARAPGAGARSDLKVRVMQFNEDATSLEQATELTELTLMRDGERVRVEGNTVSVRVDPNLGNQPAGAKMRVVYHPPDHAPLVGMAPGLAAPSSGKLELFKAGKRSKPSKSTSQSR